MPMPLFVVAAATPATSVPWPMRRVVARVRVRHDEVASRKNLRAEVWDSCDACVDDGDDHAPRAVADVPRLRQANRRQVALAQLEERIVRDLEGVTDVVRHGCGDRGLA
jgi:hypothetical protein